MKKFSLLSLLIVLSLVLAACSGGSGNTTPTGAAGSGDTFGTALPMVTEDVIATEAVLVPTFAPTDVVGGGVVDSTAMPAQGDAVGTGIPTTGDIPGDRLSEVMDFSVVSTAGDNLGDVNDLVLDVTGSTIQYVAVGVGGFLGIGERNAMIPFDQLTVGTGDQAEQFVFSGDMTVLENVPEVDFAAVDFSATGWDTELVSFWANPTSGAQGSDVAGTPMATEDVSGGMTTEVSPTMTVGDTTMTTEVSPTMTVGDTTMTTEVSPTMTVGDTSMGSGQMEVSFVLASQLLGAVVTDRNASAIGTVVPGMTGTMEAPMGTVEAPMGTVEAPMGTVEEPVLTPQGDNLGGVGGTVTTSVAGSDAVGSDLGEVGDALVDLQTGTVNYVVVAAAASLELGEVWVLVPMSQVTLMSENGLGDNAVTLMVDGEQLRTAPNFNADELPDTTTTGWDADLVTFWGTTP